MCSTFQAGNPRVVCFCLLLVLSTITSMKKFTLSLKLYSPSLPWCRCRYVLQISRCCCDSTGASPQSGPWSGAVEQLWHQRTQPYILGIFALHTALYAGKMPLDRTRGSFLSYKAGQFLSPRVLCRLTSQMKILPSLVLYSD